VLEQLSKLDGRRGQRENDDEKVIVSMTRTLREGEVELKKRTYKSSSR
jgi:hypothetical protein